MPEPSSMPRPPISIIGAGITGLTLSRCLQRQKIAFVLYERDTPEQVSKRHNYAITISLQSQDSLVNAAGLDRNVLNSTLVDSATASRAGRKTVRVNRRKLESALREGLENVRFGCKVKEVNVLPNEKGGKASVAFENGEQTSEGSIIVGADGAHSALRKAIAPETDFTIYPYPAFNGKRRLNRKVYDEAFAPHVSSLDHVLEHKIGDAVFHISIDDVKDENVDISYTYSRPARHGNEEGQDPLYTPDRPNSGAKDIPAEFYEEVASHASSLPPPFDQIFNPEALKQDRLLSWLMRSVSVPQSRLDDAARSGVVLIGDAVHHTPILGSDGANEGIEDAVVLAEILTKDRIGNEGIGKFHDGRVGEWESWVREGVGRLVDMHAEGGDGGAKL